MVVVYCLRLTTHYCTIYKLNSCITHIGYRNRSCERVLPIPCPLQINEHHKFTCRLALFISFAYKRGYSDKYNYAKQIKMLFCCNEFCDYAVIYFLVSTVSMSTIHENYMWYNVIKKLTMRPCKSAVPSFSDSQR